VIDLPELHAQTTRRCEGAGGRDGFAERLPPKEVLHGRDFGAGPVALRL